VARSLATDLWRRPADYFGMQGTGTVEAICTAPAGGEPMEERESVEAVAGKGLRGDRYFDETGTYSNNAQVDDIPRDLTLFEVEALDHVAADYDIDLDVTDHRRNVTVSDVAVDHLLGERFRIGDVVCEGVRLCEPCSYLEQITEEGVYDALVHRAGLNAAVVESGEMRVGDAVEPL
jgi:hypothetical protein